MTRIPSDATRPTSPVLTWLSGHLPLAISGGGGLLYLVIGGSDRMALKPFGVTPAEVGIDYTTTIWGAIPFIFMTVGSLGVFLFVSNIGNVHKSGETPSNPVRNPGASRFNISRKWLVAYLIVMVPLSSAAGLEQWRYVRVVTQGHQYEPLLSHMSPLQIRADAVQIAWKDATPSKTSLPSGRTLLLGTANGTAVIFEADTFRTWRIPVGDLVLVTAAPVSADGANNPDAKTDHKLR